VSSDFVVSSVEREGSALSVGPLGPVLSIVEGVFTR